MSVPFSEGQHVQDQETSRSPGDLVDLIFTSIQGHLKILFDSEFESLDRCKEDERVFKLCCERYRCFRQIHQQLLTLTFAVGTKCDAILGDTLIPASYFHGYRKLPNEIIIRIASLLSSEDVLQLTHVNQHLRQVLCPISSLWTDVGTGEPSGILRMKLERSKHNPLDVVLDFRDYYMPTDVNGKSCTASYELMFAQHKRWQSIYVDNWARDSGFDFHTIPKEHLQSVKTLEIAGFEDRVDAESMDFILASCEEFHRAWTMPASRSLCSLTTLILEDDIPFSETPSDVCFPNLTDLQLSFTYPEFVDDSCLNAFITGHDTLEKLSISVYGLEHLHRTFRYESSLPIIELPHLKRLQCTIRLPEIRCSEDQEHCSRTSRSFCNVIRGISAPAVEEIELEWSQGLDLIGPTLSLLPAVGTLFRYEDMRHLKSFQFLDRGLGEGLPSIFCLRPFVTELHELLPTIKEITWRLPPQKSTSMWDQFPTGPCKTASLALPGMKETVAQLTKCTVNLPGTRKEEDRLEYFSQNLELEGVTHKLLPLRHY